MLTIYEKNENGLNYDHLSLENVKIISLKQAKCCDLSFVYSLTIQTPGCHLEPSARYTGQSCFIISKDQFRFPLFEIEIIQAHFLKIPIHAYVLNRKHVRPLLSSNYP